MSPGNNATVGNLVGKTSGPFVEKNFPAQNSAHMLHCPTLTINLSHPCRQPFHRLSGVGFDSPGLISHRGYRSSSTSSKSVLCKISAVCRARRRIFFLCRGWLERTPDKKIRGRWAASNNVGRESPFKNKPTENPGLSNRKSNWIQLEHSEFWHQLEIRTHLNPMQKSSIQNMLAVAWPLLFRPFLCFHGVFSSRSGLTPRRWRWFVCVPARNNWKDQSSPVHQTTCRRQIGEWIVLN